MSIGDSAIFGMMSEKMSWLAQRQRVLSQNIANADTPNYKARDIAKLSFSDQMAQQSMKVNLEVTNPQHVSLPDANDKFEEGTAASTYETTISENGVVLEEQMMKLGSTAGDYNMATNIYRKYLALHRTALGRGQG
ncbi:MAG: flagellar basal body rod protein FlgB [Alphaproteobacteria bacterium]|nr:flagellar basal body rod protein FlgB [Alphaproteobacteria bacterium]